MSEETDAKLRPTKFSVFDSIESLEESIQTFIEGRKKNAGKVKSNDLASLLKEVKSIKLAYRKAHHIKVQKENAPKKVWPNVKVTPVAEKFLRLEGDYEITRVDIGNAIRTYLCRVPGQELKDDRWAFLNNKKPYRNLKDPNRPGAYLLDDTMKKLLNVSQYIKDVKAGKVTSDRKDKVFDRKTKVVIDDPVINSASLMRLYNKLALPSEKKAPAKKAPAKAKGGKKAKPVEEDDDEGEEEKPVSKKTTASKKAPPKKKAAAKEEEASAEDETPKKSTKKIVAPKKKVKVEEVVEEDDDEEDDSEEEDVEDEDESDEEEDEDDE